MIRKVFVALFGAMALGQVLSFSGFVDAVETYGVGGRALAATVAVLFVATEAAAVVLLVGGERQQVGSVLAVAVMAAWTVIAAQAFAGGLSVPNCGCFGTFLSQELRWWVLLEDAYLLVLAAVLVRSTRASTEVPERGSRTVRATSPG